MRRREFIKYGTAGMISLTAGGLALWSKTAFGSGISILLTIVETEVELVDGNTVFMWAFRHDATGPRVPGPIIEVLEGQSITISVMNQARGHHGFAIRGTDISTGTIPPNESRTITFVAPAARTYMYLDPENAPVNRLLGLHGAFIVLPASGNTPYSQPSHQIQRLFNDLGSEPFPGMPWRDKRVYPYGRTWVWVFNEIEPRWNEMAARGELIDPERLRAEFLPSYFTLNGLSGYFSAHDEPKRAHEESAHECTDDALLSNMTAPPVRTGFTVPTGKEGEPALIRTMNAGIGCRPPHIHGNHCYVLSGLRPELCLNRDKPQAPSENVLELDTWALHEEEIADVLLPFRRPPDIPLERWPPVEEAFPLVYAMHPHDELSQTAAGGLYPQGMITDWKLKSPLTGAFRCEPHHVSFEQFGCDPPHENPPTPDRLAPTRRPFRRKFFGSADIVMPDGQQVRFWGFEDPDDPNVRNPVPSALIRVRQGELVHVTLEASKNAHTIHLHGIEPTTMNDGVGHTSFEVTGQYTYQFRPHQAGTYFYHCHKNTTLHFEMGMFGGLIVDPPEGQGTAFVGGPTYDVEALWVFDDVDPTWRELGHDAGMCPGGHVNVGLNNFRPRYFMLGGVPYPRTLTKRRSQQCEKFPLQFVVIDARKGQTILIRFMNASYSELHAVFDFDVTVVGADGRPLRDAAPEKPGEYASAFTICKGAVLEIETAQRRDLLVGPLDPGSYRVKVEFKDLIRETVLGVVETFVNVTE